MVEPSSTPAGTWTLKVEVWVARPSPRHAGHGVSILWPVAPQRVHGVEVTIWPRIELRTRRTSPLPWHSVHVTGEVPGAHPVA